MKLFHHLATIINVVDSEAFHAKAGGWRFDNKQNIGSPPAPQILNHCIGKNNEFIVEKP